MRRSAIRPCDRNRYGVSRSSHDVVVVAGVERDVVAAGLGDGADHVERLVAVERRHLDGDHVLDLGEPPPERVRQHAPADGRLQVEADQRDDLGHRAAVGDQRVVVGVVHRRQAQQRRVVAQLAEQRGLGDGLRRLRRRCRRCGPAARAAGVARGHLLGAQAPAPARTGRSWGRGWRTAWCGRRRRSRPRRPPRSSAHSARCRRSSSLRSAVKRQRTGRDHHAVFRISARLGRDTSVLDQT